MQGGKLGENLRVAGVDVDEVPRLSRLGALDNPLKNRTQEWFPEGIEEEQKAVTRGQGPSGSVCQHRTYIEASLVRQSPCGDIALSNFVQLWS